MFACERRSHVDRFTVRASRAGGDKRIKSQICWRDSLVPPSSNIALASRGGARAGIMTSRHFDRTFSELGVALG